MNSSPPIIHSDKELDERQKQAMADLSSLSRVSHKLAMTEAGSALERVLALLLPRLLKRIGSNHFSQMELLHIEGSEVLLAKTRESHDKIHAKLVEMLSHTMKRVRADANCKLPCLAIVQLLLLEEEPNKISANTAVDPFTLNLALAFLTLGLPRCTRDETGAVLPGLLLILPVHSGIDSLQSAARKTQSQQVIHLILLSLERIATDDELKPSVKTMLPSTLSTLSGTKMEQDSTHENTVSTNMDQVREIVQQQEHVAAALYDLLLDALLYQPSASATMPPPGLSQAGHERLIAAGWGAQMTSQIRLKEFKLALIQIIAPARRWAIFMNSIGSSTSLGTCRTMALLVTASGDGHPEVADRAKGYLNAHLEGMRIKLNDEKDGNAANSIVMMCALLALPLGSTNAASALSKIPHFSIASLGMAPPPMGQPMQQQLILSLKRRMVADKTSCAVLTFVAKMLTDTPQLLDESENAHAIGSLSVLAANKVLGSITSTSGFSILRAAPYIAAAQLLNAITLRMSGPGTLEIFAKALMTACSILSHASSPRPSLVHGSNEGSIAIRDALYGVICNLSRSSDFCKEGYIFGLGQQSPSSSIQTATLLFGCASNEEETLRPRAVAALDALLGAYSRLYQNDDDSEEDSMEVDSPEVSNPWMTDHAVSELHIAKKAKGATLDRTGLARALLPLLWNGAQGTHAKASRVASARWSNDLLKNLDGPNACHLLCFLAGDSDVTVSAIAREGLGLTKKVGETYDELSTNELTIPDFAELTTVLFQSSRGTASMGRPRYYDFSYLGKAASLRFGLICLLNDLYGGEDEAVRVYVQALAETLSLFGSSSTGKGSAQGRDSIDLLDECAICFAGCISTSAFARSMIVDSGSLLSLEDLEFLTMNGASTRARRYLAEACGYLYEDTAVWLGGQAFNLSSWLKKNHLAKTLDLCAQKVADSQKDVFTIGEVHGAAFLGARCVRAFRLHAGHEMGVSDDIEMELCWRNSSSIIQVLGKGISHIDEVIGKSFTESLGIALSYDSIDAPILNPRLYEGAASALCDLELALKRFGNGDHTDPIRASSLAQAAGVALAASTSGAGSTGVANIGSARTQCVDALFALTSSEAFRKDADVALAAGEALATYADAYSPDNAVWSSFTDVWPESYSESLLCQLPPHQQVLYRLLERDILSSNPHTRSGAAPALLAVVGLAAKRVNNNNEFSGRALVVECTKRLGNIQQAFVSLLADPKSKQLSRESCCLGLAACHGLAEARGKSQESTLSQDLNDRLLRAFGQTSNYGGSAMQETASQNAERLRRNQLTGIDTAASINESFGVETEVGGAAGLGEAALGAYREMAAAASALGRSDVLYALLLLSVSHPVWSTPGPRDRYSASSLLGENSLVGSRTNTTEMREALRPHLGKLIPRLLRAKNDPNKQTREQMETLWLGLTGGGAEARQAITHHLLPTVDSLIDDAANKLWRARVGACGALAEVIVGRSWIELGGGDAVVDDDEVMLHTNTASASAGIRLLRLWRVAMRAIDDVRGAVRESGEVLARSVRALTIRLCDPTRADSIVDAVTVGVNARCAASTSLRWLVKHGLSQVAPEATGLCISCLIGVIEVVQPHILEPSLPDLIGALLMAMSGLEPATLNYLQVRAAGSTNSNSYEQLERARLQLAQSGPIGGALQKCLDMISSVHLSTQQAVISQLDSALRTGAGFATRAAVADTVSTLCANCPLAFSFSGASSNNPTVRLLRALYLASERERGQGAKEKMAHALGNLAALSPGQSVRSLAIRACARYARSTGNNDDPSARHASASALRALAVRASNQFADGGPNDIYCRRVLPMAFLGQKDSDDKVARLWKEVWDEGGQASGAMSKGHGVRLEERLLPGLVQSSVEALNDLSWTRRVSAARALLDLVQLNILSPVDQPIWDCAVNEGVLSRARQRAEQSTIATKACLDVVMRPRLWSGKNEVVRAMVAIACKWVTVGGTDYQSSLVLGCKNETMFPLRPIAWTTPETMHDLYEGDNFFELTVRDDAEVAEEAITVDMDASPTDNDDGETSIDFQEGDKLLAECNQETEIDRIYFDESTGTIVFSGMCKALLEQALPKASKQSLLVSPEELLPYKAAAFQGISDLLKSFTHSDSDESAKAEKRLVYRMMSPLVMPMIDFDDFMDTSDKASKDSAHPPLVVARIIDCLSCAMWSGIGVDSNCNAEDGTYMAKLFLRIQTKQSAWSVREAAVLGSSKLVQNCDVAVLRHHESIAVLLDCAMQASKDRKFWRVRLAGLKLLRALVLRAGDATDSSSVFSIGPKQTTGSSTNKQLILEALLPSKEKIIKISRSSLSDSESQVTEVATEVCSALSWWP